MGFPSDEEDCYLANYSELIRGVNAVGDDPKFRSWLRFNWLAKLGPDIEEKIPLQCWLLGDFISLEAFSVPLVLRCLLSSIIPDAFYTVFPKDVLASPNDIGLFILESSGEPTNETPLGNPFLGRIAYPPFSPFLTALNLRSTPVCYSDVFLFIIIADWRFI